jgi:1-acyl-sn-glycerol-3-phosphate acyltransferase
MKYVRAALRALVAVPVFIAFGALTTVQAFIVGPLTKNYTTIPNLIYNTMRRIFGYKVVFNKASAPVVKDKRVLFVANHLALTDFVVLGSVLNGTFAGKGDVLKWPLIAPMARAINYIGLRRSTEFNPESRAKIISNFNKGFNTILFPEGTTSDGKQVNLFRAALITPLFGEKGVGKDKKEVALKEDVVVQPVAIKITSVNGKDATGNDELRNMYSMPKETNMLREFWKRLQIKRTVIELTTLPPLSPKDFKDAKDLINKAALDVAGVINPGQTTFTKAQIPGQNP